MPPAGLFGAGFTEDPHGLYARLRADWGPVAPVRVAPGVRAWLVLGYQEVLAVTRDVELFSSDARHWHATTTGWLPRDSPLLPMLGWRPALTRQDGPAHLRLRQAVFDALRRIDQQRLRRLTARDADALIDGWLRDGKADLVGRFARPLSALTFARLLGMPDGDGERLHALAGTVIDSAAGALAADQEIRASLLRLVAARRASPAEDIPSWLLAGRTALSEAELVHQLAALVLNGLESISNLIGNTLAYVLARPHLLADLAAGRSTVADILDLALWAEPPLHNVGARWATSDMTFAGHWIQAGDMLVLALAGANADPAVHHGADPRTPTASRAHLAWGAGPHACPARDPALLIAESAIERLLQRVPALTLAVDPTALTWRPSPWTRSLTTLPAHFPPPPHPAPTPEAAPPPPTQTTEDARRKPRATNWAWWNLDT